MGFKNGADRSRAKKGGDKKLPNRAYKTGLFKKIVQNGRKSVYCGGKSATINPPDRVLVYAEW